MKRALPTFLAVFAMFATVIVGCAACPAPDGSDSPSYRSPPYTGTGKPNVEHH